MDKTATISPNSVSSEKVYEDDDVSFWFLQLSGWFALALISFFVLLSGIIAMNLPLATSFILSFSPRLVS